MTKIRASTTNMNKDIGLILQKLNVKIEYEGI